mgnify:CR=1 FL=1
MSHFNHLQSENDIQPAPPDTAQIVSQYYQDPGKAQQLVNEFIHAMFQAIDRKEIQEFNAMNSILWELLEGHKTMRQRRTKAGYSQKFSIETLEDMIEELQCNFVEYIRDIRGPETPPSGRYSFNPVEEQDPEEVTNELHDAVIDTLTGEAISLSDNEPTADDLAAMEKFLAREMPEHLNK